MIRAEELRKNIRQGLHRVPDLFPEDRVAGLDNAVVQRDPVGSTTPVRVESLLEPGNSFVHSLARPRFPGNFKPQIADSQDSTTAPGKFQPGNEEICPTDDGVNRRSKFAADLFECFSLHDSDLAPSALIGIPLEPAVGRNTAGRYRIHRSPVGSLDPD